MSLSGLCEGCGCFGEPEMGEYKEDCVFGMRNAVELIKELKAFKVDCWRPVGTVLIWDEVGV